MIRKRFQNKNYFLISVKGDNLEEIFLELATAYFLVQLEFAADMATKVTVTLEDGDATSPT